MTNPEFVPPIIVPVPVKGPDAVKVLPFKLIVAPLAIFKFPIFLGPSRVG